VFFIIIKPINKYKPLIQTLAQNCAYVPILVRRFIAIAQKRTTAQGSEHFCSFKIDFIPILEESI